MNEWSYEKMMSSILTVMDNMCTRDYPIFPKYSQFYKPYKCDFGIFFILLNK